MIFVDEERSRQPNSRIHNLDISTKTRRNCVASTGHVGLHVWCTEASLKKKSCFRSSGRVTGNLFFFFSFLQFLFF